MSGLFREIGGKVEKWVVNQRDGWLRRENSGFLRNGWHAWLSGEVGS
jgi:hypothetical protein